MKFIKATSFLTLSLLPFVKCNPKECVTDFEEGKDYFPIKVNPIESEKWSVTYENSYKIVRNLAGSKSYLLYQCGTPVPSNVEGSFDAVVPVPLGDFGVHFTTFVPFFELLGLRTSISAFFGPASYLHSPCLKTLIDESNVATTGWIDLGNATQVGDVGLSIDLPSFVGFETAFKNQFLVSESSEDTNMAKFEWIKYYSLFFNLEEEANEVYKKTLEEYTCEERNAGLLASDAEENPTILWAAWSEYCGGWDVARTCPEYYCEFAEACSANLLVSEEGSYYSDLCFRNYMTTEEFVEFGKDADYWIYPSGEINSALTQFKEELKDFVSVKNKQVFDNQGAGPNAWFELRLAEPDLVVRDVCSIVGHEKMAVPIPQDTKFLRNVYNTDLSVAPLCDDPAAPLKTLVGSVCVKIDNSMDEDDSSGPTSGPQLFLTGLLLTTVFSMI